ncbi:cadherin-like domain-containing protein [Salinibacter altiplanensis]|uniref:cadherin-like domain-containing protein n=1 Tax=Salinibacter altiplanensis TaxID=1803181 RepID=UPI001F1D6609|nr:cadherin-like domain-containing protein [Salinibacter altiplanensis]
MRVRIPNAVRPFLSVLALGLVLSGCDGTIPMGTEPGTASESASSLFQKTDDLGTRMTGLRKTASLTRTASPDLPSTDGSMRIVLASVTRVAPPRDTMRVGALVHAGGTIYIGYKTPGGPFGGGIDRLDASDPTTLLAPSGLGSDVLDVEDVAYDEDDEALYLTGGLRPSAYDGDLRGTPASLLKVDGMEAPQATVTGLTGSVGKGVAVAPERDGKHEAYAVSGGEALSQFGVALDDRTRRDISGAALESVETTPSALFVADRGGSVYAGPIEDDAALTEVSGLEDERVEQLQVRRDAVLEGDRLFLALGTGGVAVLDATNGDVLFRREGPTYTSVSLHEEDPAVPNEPSGLVYAARPDGRLDVYQVGREGLDPGDPATGLRDVGAINLGALMGAAPPIHRVVGVGCHVYAAGRDGTVVALKMGTAQGCGTGGHQLPTAADDSDKTTEREATTTAVLDNDRDPDGALNASTVRVQGGPAHGTVRVDASAGTVTYAPEPGFTGTDEYTYTVTDEDGWVANEATVTITVEALAPPPPPGG